VLYEGDTIRVPDTPWTRACRACATSTPSWRHACEQLTGIAPTEEDRLFGLDLLLNDDGNHRMGPSTGVS